MWKGCLVLVCGGEVVGGESEPCGVWDRILKFRQREGRRE